MVFFEIFGVFAFIIVLLGCVAGLFFLGMDYTNYRKDVNDIKEKMKEK